MEIKIESKVGQLHNNDDRIYAFLSNCNHFQQFSANERVKNWQSDSESCSFTVDGGGDVAFRIIERRPNDLVKFSIEHIQADSIFLWVQLKNAGLADTRVKLTVKLYANPVVRMLISKPLKQALDKIIETLETLC